MQEGNKTCVIAAVCYCDPRSASSATNAPTKIVKVTMGLHNQAYVAVSDLQVTQVAATLN